MNWNDYSYVVRSTYRKAVVLALDVPRTPTQIAKKAGIANSHASRALTELEKKKLVKCLTPKAVTGRIYTLTAAGSSIKRLLEKSE